MADDTPQNTSDVPERFSVDFTGLTLLGIYRVDERLAEGGMGSVYLGHDENLGRRVVIKVPHVKFLGEPGFRTRFAREITELVRLEHPHIVRIIAQGTHDDVPFFVLQFLGGGSLEEVFEARGGPMPQDELTPWMRTIATTLDFVHGRRTIHRDVKPANVIFDEEGHVYLSDFGVAKALEGEDANLTEAGTGIGSPKYMAPEQGYGKELTPTADQYALASMLYEGLAGRPPYTETSAIELLVKKGSADPDPLADLVPDLPPAAAAVVMRGLSRDAEERYASCTELMDRFEEALAPETVAATPTPPPRKSRTPLFVALGAVAVAAILFFVVGRGGETVQDGATNIAGVMHLTVIEPGAAPRTRLRYDVAKGAKQVLALDQDSGMTVTMGGREVMGGPRPHLFIAAGMHVDEIAANGDAHITWRMQESRFGKDGKTGIKPELLDQVKREYASLTGTVVLTPNGLVRSAALPDDYEFADDTAQELQVLWWALRTAAVPYPVEPIGIGARWRVSETGRVMGMDVTHVRTYELVERDGTKLRMTGSVAQTAERQPVQMKAGPGGPSLSGTLLTLHTTGQSDMHTDLGHIVPTRYAYDMRMKNSYVFGDLPAGKKPHPDAIAHVEYTMEMSIERR